MHPWVLVLHHLEEEDAHHLRHRAARGRVTRLAGSGHLDAVDTQLGGEIPEHVGFLHGGLVVERVHGGSLKRGEAEVGLGTGREKSPQADKTGFNTALVTNQNLFKRMGSYTKAGKKK